AVLGAIELVLRLALSLFLAPLVPKRGVASEVPGGLLGTSGDLVQDAHVSLLVSAYDAAREALPPMRQSKRSTTLCGRRQAARRSEAGGAEARLPCSSA